jgi:hypothetical protein
MTFDGESTAPWDSTTMWKFHTQNPEGVVAAYFNENTHNGKWLYEVPTNTTLPTLVASIPNGEVQATFTDADFQITGCSSFATEQKVNIWM